MLDFPGVIRHLDFTPFAFYPAARNTAAEEPLRTELEVHEHYDQFCRQNEVPARFLIKYRLDKSANSGHICEFFVKPNWLDAPLTANSPNGS
jgi:hypothetical protein